MAVETFVSWPIAECFARPASPGCRRFAGWRDWEFGRHQRWEV